jgi:hypothetical protein
MVAANSFDVHVDDLATLEVLVEERYGDVLRLGDQGEEFGLYDFGVSTITHDFIDLLLLIIGLHVIQALLFVRLHDFF